MENTLKIYLIIKQIYVQAFSLYLLELRTHHKDGYLALLPLNYKQLLQKLSMLLAKRLITL
ncbi:hypothetical protein clem_12305 [Legionella clemsonensis]|uniref:Uncharacterized protein n=1 Tax=Legionella clemsonensis TaxID=1867846 RepID=A0A222P569_9GAMM|nr:hypothetical protein clem_12305 [Legionella clemsonensis]